MTARMRGWLLDLYEDEADGLRMWFITEDDTRVCLHQPLERYSMPLVKSSAAFLVDNTEALSTSALSATRNPP